ncbi:MAG: AAA family ATPase [Deltaproteobacteria bacterium]|nr:AAA family ATPase [Deltaproteobacteria bacterium]
MTTLDEPKGAAALAPSDDIDPVWDAELRRAHDDLAEAAARAVARGPAGETTGADLVRIYDEQQERDPYAFWLVDALLPRDALCILGAEPKVGKTWFWLEAALAVASGGRAFGEFIARPRTSRVLAFALEDGGPSIGARIKALDYLRTEGLHVEVRPHLDFATDLSAAAWILASTRHLGGVDLIVIDTLRDAHSGDENDATAMRAVMAQARLLRDLCGAAVMVTHHMKKPSKADADLRPAHRLRGSTAIHGSADAIIALELRGREREDGADDEQAEDDADVDERDARLASKPPWHRRRPRGETGERTTLGVDVELRDAVGAGLFGLELFAGGLGKDGRASFARWTFTRGLKGVAAHEVRRRQVQRNQGDHAREAVLLVLETLHAEQPAKHNPVDAIRVRAGISKQAVTDALYSLQQEGKGEQALNKRGWRLRREASSVPNVPNVLGTNGTNGNDGTVIVPIVPTPIGGAEQRDLAEPEGGLSPQQASGWENAT